MQNELSSSLVLFLNLNHVVDLASLPLPCNDVRIEHEATEEWLRWGARNIRAPRHWPNNTLATLFSQRTTSLLARWGMIDFSPRVVAYDGRRQRTGRAALRVSVFSGSHCFFWRSRGPNDFPQTQDLVSPVVEDSVSANSHLSQLVFGANLGLGECIWASMEVMLHRRGKESGRHNEKPESCEERKKGQRRDSLRRALS